MLRMILIVLQYELNLIGDFRGPFRDPRVPSQTRCFEGATRSFMGPGPLGPPRNRPLVPPTKYLGNGVPPRSAIHYTTGFVALTALTLFDSCERNMDSYATQQNDKTQRNRLLLL